MVYVYMLRCRDGSFYTGITWSLEKRLREHTQGLSVSTKWRLPVELVHWEEYDDRIKAAQREKEIKGWNRKKKEILISSLH